jgi:PIN domain nuclease of toxin-antitoxin system
MSAFAADACAIIAFYGQPQALGRDGLAAMRDGEVLVIPVTVWEIARKVAIGKLRPLPTRGQSLAVFLRAEGFTSLDFTWTDAEAAATLPAHHSDPMDRMLIATAIRCDTNSG